MKQLLAVYLVFCVLAVFSQHVDPRIEQADSVYYSDPDKSCKLCLEALKVAKLNEDVSMEADARVCLARFYLLKANYSEAETNLKKSIGYFKQSGDKGRLGSAYNLYAIFYDRQNDKQKSYDYQNESIRLFKEIDNIQGMCNMMNNLANAYITDNMFSNAEELLDEIETYKDRLSQRSLYFLYQNRGILFAATGKNSDALKCYIKAMEIARAQKMRDSQVTILTLQGKLSLADKRYVSARTTLKLAEEMAVQENLEYELEEIYAAQEELYLATGSKAELDTAHARKKRLEDQKVLREKTRQHLEEEFRKKAEQDSLRLADERQRILKEKEKRERLKEEEEGTGSGMLLVGVGIIFCLFVMFAVYRLRRRR